MQEIRRKRVSVLGLRAFAPKALRVVALLLIVAGVVAVVVSYYRLKGRPEFRLRSGPARLSTTVVHEINGLEHREMKNGKLYFMLKATRDLRFDDGHHELENVYLEVHPEQGGQPDKISAQRTITTEDNQRFTFSGAVQVETRDRLVAKSETMEYDLREEVGVVPAPITFERENISGRADAATLNARAKQLELRGGVVITVLPDAKANAEAVATNAVPKVSLRGLPLVIKSAQAKFDQAKLHLEFTGSAVAEQGQDVMSGDTLSGTLNEQKRVKYIEAKGSSYLRSVNPGRSAEVFSEEMHFYFNPDQKLEAVHAIRNVRARTLDADAEATLNAPGAVDLDFLTQGERSLLKEMRAGERPVVTLAAPKSKAGDPKAANKRLTADGIRLYWHATGKDLERAEVDGNAELLVEPVQASPTADRKHLFARRFDCDFYDAGNLARTFTATGGAKAVVEPLQPTGQKGTRTLTSETMVAQFVRETQDVQSIEAKSNAHFTELAKTLTAERMTAQFAGAAGGALERVDAQGDAKFNEADRNGQAAGISYTAGDGLLRMRGGEPVVWDAKARLKAAEIDSDTRSKISYGRGRAVTTYYSQEQTNGAAPFKNVKSPVFVAANNAEFQHDAGVGIYTGAARAWQDDNFVKGERITLRREQKRMDVEGGVQSALYQARRKEASGARAVVPVFATSQRMSYTDAERLLHYETDVDIKQGTERITSAVADVFLLKDTYEVERTVAQRTVVVTQPGKRGAGEWAQYTAADETVVLTGNPARVEDSERGTSESRRFVVYLREDRVVSDGGGEGKQSSGRVRSTHKIKKQEKP
jgi:LPS export ABC transporter protein LptC